MGARRYSGSSIEDEDEDEDVWDEVAEVAEEAEEAGAEVEAEVEEAVDIEEGEVDEEAGGDSILQCYKASRSLKTPESRVFEKENQTEKAIRCINVRCTTRERS